MKRKLVSLVTWTMLICSILVLYAYGQGWEVIRQSEADLGMHFQDIYFIDEQNGWALGSGKIFHTTDGGDTWLEQKVDTQYDLYAIDFVDERTGWVAGSFAIFHTSDAGNTWTEQFRREGMYFYDVHFVNEQTGWAIGSPGRDQSAIFYTSDGGKTWDLQFIDFNGRRLYGIDFANEKVGWVVGWDVGIVGVGIRGLILYTTDGGQTWEKNTSEFSIYGVDCVNEQECWAAGRGGILHTDDGGNSWVKHDESASFKSICFINDEFGWAVGYAGEIIHTSDGGNSWVYQQSNVSSLLESVFFVNEEVGWAVGEHGVMIHTSDGGINWQLLYDKTYPLVDMTFISDQMGWVLADDGTVLYTHDGGDTWQVQESGWLQGSLDSFYSITFINETHGWAVGEFGAMVYTTDGGETWDKTIGPISYLKDVDFVNEKSGWLIAHPLIGMECVISRTTNGGADWASTAIAMDECVEAIEFVDEKVGWAVGSRMFKTKDGGVTWESQDNGIRDLKSIVFVNDRLGWAVGSGGKIIHTTDGGETWLQQDSGTSANLTRVSFADEKLGCVATQIPGVELHTYDGGRTWLKGDIGVPELFTVVYFGDGKRCFAISRNDIIVRRDFPEPGQVHPSDEKLITTWGQIRVPVLYQNYPNPLNPETWIPYQLSETAHVEITIYASTGQLVKTLDLGEREAGVYLSRQKAAHWDGRSDSGEEVAAGVYFYSIKAGGFSSTGKMTVRR